MKLGAHFCCRRRCLSSQSPRSALSLACKWKKTGYHGYRTAEASGEVHQLEAHQALEAPQALEGRLTPIGEGAAAPSSPLQEAQRAQNQR